MKFKVTPKTIRTICRVCLTLSKNLTPLTDQLEKGSVLEMIETVTCTRVVLSEKELPSKICQMCLSFLKIANDFQVQYKNSQEALGVFNEKGPGTKQNVTVDAAVETVDNTEKLPAPVELIYGPHRFDIKDVVIIEDKQVEKSSYEGFLRNLGSEISAKFLGEEELQVEEMVKEPPEMDVFPIKQPMKSSQGTSPHRNQRKYGDLDFSKLKVVKYPENCKIQIVKTDTNTVIKTIYECSKCPKMFLRSRDFDFHNEQTHNVKNYLVCDKCGHLATTTSQLYHHQQKHKGKRFECEFCDKKYDTISHLKMHQAGHKNERAYLCNVCGKSFNYAVSLKYHMKLHQDKEMVCSICGLKFRMPNTLKRHMRTHTKDKPYVCDYCPRGFSSRGEKVSHEMRHTGVRPYSCEICGKGYIKRDNLKVHYMTHSGPWECDFCKRSFMKDESLRLHMKRNHKDVQNEDDLDVNSN